MHDDLTLHDFNAFMYSYLKPHYMVFNVKTVCTIKNSLATPTKLPLHQNDLWHDDPIFRSLVTPKEVNNATINKLTMDKAIARQVPKV